jgi:hypothetical protein
LGSLACEQLYGTKARILTAGTRSIPSSRIDVVRVFGGSSKHFAHGHVGHREWGCSQRVLLFIWWNP